LTVAIVWFRRNLRLADNPALSDAVERSSAVVPVFVRPSADSRHGPGAVSWAWCGASLESLDARLRQLGSALVVRTGAADDTLAALARETGATAVWCERDWSPQGLAEEDAARHRLARAGTELHVVEGQLLVAPTALATSEGRTYRVFTPFWRAWRRSWDETPSLRATPARIASPAVMPASTEGVFSGASDAERSWPWPPGEPGALDRLAEFTRDWLAHYETDRDRPSIRATSELSPALAWGEVSVRSVAAAAVSAGSGSEPFLRQLAWRDFAYHVVRDSPTMLDEPLRAEFSEFPWSASVDDLEAWRAGRTGYPLVDAGMRQLAATGWMHNRVRLVAGSFLTKDLLGRWQDGEAAFRDLLADYDPALNAFNWQWVAGSGADAAPYFRVFNPTVQGSRFDPDGAYVRTWVPELGGLDDRWIHRPWDAPSHVLATARIEMGRTYPRRIVDHAEARARALAAYASVRAATGSSQAGRATESR